MLYQLCCTFVISALLLVPATLALPASAVATRAPTPPAATAASHLLQFVAAGQVMGFEAGGVYTASPDHALHIEFRGASGVAPASEGAAPALQAPIDQLAHAAPLRTVTWRGLWPGIDLTYGAVFDGIAGSTYTIAPGAAPGAIALHYTTPVQVAADGSLSVEFPTGQMRESAPVAWQEIDGQRVPVPVAFQVRDGGEVGFALGRFDPTYTLTIDPIMSWVSYLGGYDQHKASAIAVDTGGNVYIAGTSNLSWGTPVRPFTVGRVGGAAATDAFVAKLTSTGGLLWNTFLGGANEDSGEEIGLDSSGNVYVAGQTYYSSWGDPIRTLSDQGDTFVAKLNPDGGLTWNTFLGGPGGDYVHGIAVTGSGIVYLAGESTQGWPGTAPVHAFGTSNEMYLAQLNTNGGLTWNTFQGGAGSDGATALALDTNGNAYVAGNSTASWGTNIAHGCLPAGCGGFVAKFHDDGQIEWNTFLGANHRESASGIAVATDFNIYVTGSDSTTNQAFVSTIGQLGQIGWDTPLGGLNGQGKALTIDGSGRLYAAGTSTQTWGTPKRAYTQDVDTFVARVAPGTGEIQWNTFLGAAGQDDTGGIAHDALGNAYVVGMSRNSWEIPARGFSGLMDGYAAELSTGGSFGWDSFLGGSEDDIAEAVAVDAAGGIYVAGFSTGMWGSAPKREYAGLNDAFVVKLDSTGKRLWMTFLGGAGNDAASGIAVDGSGYSYVVGSSNATWGTSPVRSYQSLSDGFVAVLDSAGQLQSVTFLGGPGNDYAVGVALDAGRNIYVAGESGAAWAGSVPVHGYSGGRDGFVARLSPAGALSWHTFLGGPGWDSANGVAAAGDGSLYTTGFSTQNWGTAPVRHYVGGADAFVVKLTALNGAFGWNTFLGGSGDDAGTGIALDSSGVPYVAGYSTATWGTPVGPWIGSDDAFAARVLKTGNLDWNTFLGGGGADRATSIVTDAHDNLLVQGYSFASWGLPIRPYSGLSDGFLAQLTPTGVRTWNMFLGSSGFDSGNGLTVDSSSGRILVAGASTAIWSTGYAFGGLDAFLAGIDPRWAMYLPQLIR